MYRVIATQEGKVVSVFEVDHDAPSFCNIKYKLLEGEFTKVEVESLGYIIEEIE